MHGTNDHHPKRTILYARVSTDEQANSGHSLDQQLEALREYAAHEGYEVLEEAVDAGYSGGSLARPGIDRVRDLVAAGNVSMVLAQDRDRFARKVVLNGLLDEEFSKHGCKTKALNDYGDDSPEGALMRGIQTQFAEYERAKITERTRRGKVAKARKGQILRSSKPPFGFKYTATGDGLLIHKPEMAVVEKIFHMAAAGLGRHAIQTRLYAEGVPSPKGERVWSRSTLKKILFSDLYIPYSREELAGLVPAEVLDRVDADARFGIWWFGRKQVTVTGYSPSPPENGGQVYKEHTTTRIRPKEERTAVPVPAYLPRCLVDQAHASLAANKSTERKYLAREWELRGILRCVCGSIMATQTARSRAGNSTYHYYRCGRRRKLGSMCDCTQKSITATDIEEIVWSFVSRLLQDPEAIRRGMERLIEHEQIARTDNPEREAQTWADKIDECDRRRSAYQDQQAAGLMTLQELGAKLNELENIRRTAEQELVALKTHQRRMDDLENDYVALLESMAQIVPEALNSLTGEERNRIYQMLRLEVFPASAGYEVNGAFCTPETRWGSGAAKKRRSSSLGRS